MCGSCMHGEGSVHVRVHVCGGQRLTLVKAPGEYNTCGCLLASTYTCPHIDGHPHKQTPAHTNTHHEQEREASKKTEIGRCKIIQLDLGHVNSNINTLLL